MLRSLTKAWWLLALCGILDALNAAMNLLMRNPDDSLGLRRFALPGTVWDMAMLALVAGVCALAAGLWCAGRETSWLIALHGLALGAYGLLFFTPLVRGPLSFRPISLLFVAMAVSLGAFASRLARNGAPGPALAGLGFIGFALSFVAVGFGWVRLAGPHSFWLWMSSWFALCAGFKLWLAVRLHSEGGSGDERSLAPLPAPGRAH